MKYVGHLCVENYNNLLKSLEEDLNSGKLILC